MLVAFELPEVAHGSSPVFRGNPPHVITCRPPRRLEFSQALQRGELETNGVVDDAGPCRLVERTDDDLGAVPVEPARIVCSIERSGSVDRGGSKEHRRSGRRQQQRFELAKFWGRIVHT